MPATRRRLLAIGLGAAAAAGASPAFARGSRQVSLLNLHTGDTLKATYWDGGAYVRDALAAIDKVLRDHRTGETHPISPRLLDLLSDLSDRLEPTGAVQVISGYRSPKTNAALHMTSSGVATRSLHMEGLAMDIRMPGVRLDSLRDAAVAMQAGGVGYYPGSDFVHIDVGRPRRWAG